MDVTTWGVGLGRKQYPSDKRRWFRVMEDILDDPKLGRLDLADLGLYVKLLAVLNRQKSRDGKATLDRFAACAVARRERFAYARPAFDRLAAGGLLRVSYGDGTITYHVLKWSELQGFTPLELRQESVQTPSTTPTPTPTPTKPPLTPPTSGGGPGGIFDQEPHDPLSDPDRAPGTSPDPKRAPPEGWGFTDEPESWPDPDRSSMRVRARRAAEEAEREARRRQRSERRELRAAGRTSP